MEKAVDLIDRIASLNALLRGVEHPRGQEAIALAMEHNHAQQIESVREMYTAFWLTSHLPSFYAYSSPSAPPNICQLFSSLAYKSLNLGFIARTGTNTVAQAQVEAAVDELTAELSSLGVRQELAQRLKEIYLPWPGYDGHDSELNNVPVEAMYLASNLIEDFNKYSGPIKKVLASRVLAIVGYNMNHPVNFFMTWTPDGAQRTSQITKHTGDVGPLIQLCEFNSIPVFNLSRSESIHALLEYAYQISKVCYSPIIPLDEILSRSGPPAESIEPINDAQSHQDDSLAKSVF